MIHDEEGFIYPKVKKELCVGCKLCVSTCPMEHSFRRYQALVTYAMQNKDDLVREKSSSGGVFSLIAEKTILEGGVVFGVKFDEKWNAVMSFTDKMEGLNAFYGSKYIQAYTNQAFQDARLFLETGRLVLFSGTPCQISALKCFLDKEYENLYLVDISCHGVPSPLLWNKYLSEITTSTQNITSINFRDKCKGWRDFHLTVKANEVQETDSERIVYSRNVYGSHYVHSFIKNMTLRPSCYNCHFKNDKSVSDYTLADFWGIEKVASGIDDNKGTSLVIIRSQKGIEWFPFDKCYYIEVPNKHAVSNNEGLISNPVQHPRRSIFYKEVFCSEKMNVVVNKNISIPFFYKCYIKIILSINRLWHYGFH